MAKLIDLTGQKFGLLTVIEKAPSRNRHTMWKCLCDCGNECEVSGEYLRKEAKQIRSCGCHFKKKIKEKQVQEKLDWLLGKRFGKLIVIERLKKSNIYGTLWKCKCDCGNEVIKGTSQLTSEHCKSCGCLKIESHLIDITDQKFGLLTALYFIPNEDKWHCKCDCGNEKDINSYLLKNGVMPSCGCIQYSKGEIEIKNILEKNNIRFCNQYYDSSLKRKRFDFAILNDNNSPIRLIEFDGEQHYKNIERFKEGLDIIQKRDQEKNQWAKENNIPLIRIPYWERDNITLDMILGDKYLVS